MDEILEVRSSYPPFWMAGLFCRLVALEDSLEESASESLLVSMDTITSFMPEDFSWEDSSSSEGEWKRQGEKEKIAERRTATNEGIRFLSLEALLQKSKMGENHPWRPAPRKHWLLSVIVFL